ncbi:DNA-3-methyladenine glycosylase [uncultured Oscillibacter sp.]|uniref:DNA-3-methyladenine glycosylase n=1 Tax=uncultured Oscillibacter sp. TaxID=876091 RepID=UPI0025F4E04B|nr:DNA-3-methyladenine glycosylase [uncultured Oscillibacter sp.]
MAILSQGFYLGDTVDIARRLLGKYLVRRIDGQTLVCRLTETEAYVGRCDKACHAYNYRRTARTDALFQPPGRAYVYLIYGMYDCLNIVTEPEGEPAAVLLRGAQAISGGNTMARLRYGDKPLTAARQKNLLNGPGKLCRALAVTRAENRMDLTVDGPLFLCDSPADLGLPCPALPRERICTGPRIGVDYAQEAKDFPWRFWLETEE